MQITHAIRTIIDKKNLTEQEAYDAIDQIMSGQAAPPSGGSAWK